MGAFSVLLGVLAYAVFCYLVCRFLRFTPRRRGRWHLAVLFLLAAGSASAQERAPIDWASYGVMVAGNAADLVTTGQAFSRGAHEGNGLTSTNQIGPLAASKVAAVSAIALAMRLLEVHGHPRWARAVGYVDGGVTFAAALHNRGVAR